MAGQGGQGVGILGYWAAETLEQRGCWHSGEQLRCWHGSRVVVSLKQRRRAASTAAARRPRVAAARSSARRPRRTSQSAPFCRSASSAAPRPAAAAADADCADCSPSAPSSSSSSFHVRARNSRRASLAARTAWRSWGRFLPSSSPCAWPLASIWRMSSRTTASSVSMPDLPVLVRESQVFPAEGMAVI